MTEPTADGGPVSDGHNPFARPKWLTPASHDQRTLAWVVTMRDGNRRYHPADLVVDLSEVGHLALYAASENAHHPVAGYRLDMIAHWERVYV